MRKVNVITSFSYPLRDREVVQRAEMKAEQAGLSLSAYIIACFKASEDLEKEQKQKKEEGSENTEPSQISGRQENISEVVNKPQLDTSNVFDITSYIASCSDLDMLRKMKKNGHVMESVADTRIKRVVLVG